MRWCSYLRSYLAPARKSGLFDVWVDEHLPGGDTWKTTIDVKLQVCDICILLASSNSLASDYIIDVEIAAMFRRKKSEDVHIFPIAISPFSTKAVPWLMELVLRPKDGIPLSDLHPKDRNNAMVSIVDELVELAAAIAKRKGPQSV